MSDVGPLKFKSVGGFGETAIFHRETKTLLVTDTVVKVMPEFQSFQHLC
jgi:hypothetical protein